MSAGAALGELDLASVLGAFLEQSEKYGHTADSDAEISLAHFRNELIAEAQALDVMLPGEKQRLDIGYRRAAKIAAFALATMRRIRREQARQAACNTAAEPAPCNHVGQIGREPPSREHPSGAYRCGGCKAIVGTHRIER